MEEGYYSTFKRHTPYEFALKDTDELIVHVNVFFINLLLACLYVQ